MRVEPYLARIGLDPDRINKKGLSTVRRLQEAHLKTVPFETIRVAGEPSTERHEPDVVDDDPTRYDEIVRRERGGLCFELNGLFRWLLSALGFDVTRVAGRVFSVDDGSIEPVGGHQTTVLHLDRTYLVEVGFGAELIRSPLPLDGTVREYPDGRWRAVSTPRPDAEFMIEYADPGSDEWEDRLALHTKPRTREFFLAGHEYHQYAPEAPFNDDPVVTIATDSGYKRLSTNSFAQISETEASKRSISRDEWDAVLNDEFGIELSGEPES